MITMYIRHYFLKANSPDSGVVQMFISFENSLTDQKTSIDLIFTRTQPLKYLTDLIFTSIHFLYYKYIYKKNIGVDFIFHDSLTLQIYAKIKSFQI